MVERTQQDGFPPGLAAVTGRNAALRRALSEPGLILAPGCFDCITARLVDAAGFQAAYVTGSGISMSRLGRRTSG